MSRRKLLGRVALQKVSPRCHQLRDYNTVAVHFSESIPVLYFGGHRQAGLSAAFRSSMLVHIKAEEAEAKGLRGLCKITQPERDEG